MERAELDELHRFLGTVGKASLFDYFGLQREATTEEVEAALHARRVWAQGQQANPKHRAEALWLIKYLSSCRRALVDERPAYLADVAGGERRKRTQILRLYVMGTLAGGVLTARSEQAIAEQGRRLGLDEDTVRELVEQMLAELRAERESEANVRPEGEAAPRPPPPASEQALDPDGPFVDYYAVLAVSPTVDAANLEAAYRTRYHWARRLRDARRANDLYAQLDAAWTALRDPARRLRYDRRRAEILQQLRPQPVIAPEAPLDAASATIVASPDTPAAPLPLPLVPALPAPDRASETLVPADDDLRLALAAEPPSVPPEPPPPVVVEAPTEQVVPPPRARLRLPGPARIQLKARREPHTVEITVENTGAGPMPGDVAADRPWLVVHPKALQPELPTQSFRVTIDGRQVPRGGATGVVTVDTGAAGRKSVTIGVDRRDMTRPMLAALAMSLALLALAWLVPRLLERRPPPPPPPGRLVVAVDPPAGAIYVEDRLVSTQGQLDLREGIPTDRPFSVRVEADGFATWTQQVAVAPGSRVTVEPRLDLVHPMAFEPQPDMLLAPVDPARASTLLQERAPRLAACLASEPAARLDLTIYVGAAGHPEGLLLDGQPAADSALRTCLARELRAMRFPILAGDYGIVETTIKKPLAGDAPE